MWRGVDVAEVLVEGLPRRAWLRLVPGAFGLWCGGVLAGPLASASVWGSVLF